jgi:hypothetical protein
MEKEFVPYELALRMKRLGFKENCLGTYKKEKLIITRISISESNMLKLEDCPAPLFSQAFRWFREEYKLHNGIVPYYDYYYYLIKDFNNGEEYRSNDLTEFIYEKAELACLEKLIEIVEEKLK